MVIISLSITIFFVAFLATNYNLIMLSFRCTHNSPLMLSDGYVRSQSLISFHKKRRRWTERIDFVTKYHIVQGCLCALCACSPNWYPIRYEVFAFFPLYVFLFCAQLFLSRIIHWSILSLVSAFVAVMLRPIQLWLDVVA